MYMFVFVSDAKVEDILRAWHVMREMVSSGVSVKGNYDGSNFAISRVVYFRDTSHPRSFAKITPLHFFCIYNSETLGIAFLMCDVQ